jgi:2,3-bisphosphoglycerate-independent phosphoglycerate mutase
MGNFILSQKDKKISGPLLLIIMDGVGLYRGTKEGYPGNALEQAQTPVVKGLMQSSPVYTTLKAHGRAVGLPSDDDMGNSEVGHNAMGAGRIFDQGAKLVNEALASGKLFSLKAWEKLIGNEGHRGLALEEGTNRSVHFMGLLSDGNVHSHINHLKAMIQKCADLGVQKVFVHALLDGRDVEEVSAHKYIAELEELLKKIDKTGLSYAIASGGGRMKVTMDRYGANWSLVELGWKTHVKGEGPLFPDALTAVAELRKQNPGVIDQDLPAFVIGHEGKALGPIQNDDIVIFFNFRGDRAIEISRAFTESDFNKFSREPDIKVHYAGMMEYDGDLKIPPLYLVAPPNIERTVSEYLVKNGVSQYAISETQKFGHVTYFWNGNNSEKFDAKLETWVEIPSDRISFDQTPRMKADEIADALVDAMASGKYKFLRVNFANGDMVGHTGVLPAAIHAMEAVDQNISRLLEKAGEIGATVIITADHGNCDQMIEIDKSGNPKKNENGSWMSKTSHTLCPVPLIITGKDAALWKLSEKIPSGEMVPGLGNVASTILTLLGFEPPAEYLPSLVEAK